MLQSLGVVHALSSWRLTGKLGQLAARSIGRPPCLVCPRCRQQQLFSTTQSFKAGHSKWSKTKYIKVATDRKKMNDRVHFARVIALYSKMYGPDPKFNSSLANAVAAANKASVPKAIIETAIAGGQGKSASGADLASLTVEFFMPSEVALILQLETDNKIRTMQHVNKAVKKAGGVRGSTAFCFSRRGRAVLKTKQGGHTSLSDLMDEAIEHDGAQDIEEGTGDAFLLWTDPSDLMAVTKSFLTKFDLELLTADIVWSPNEDTMVKLTSDESAATLGSLLDTLKEFSEVQAIFTNALQGTASDQAWETVERHIEDQEDR